MPRRSMNRFPRFAVSALALVLRRGCAAAFAQEGVERKILVRNGVVHEELYSVQVLLQRVLVLAGVSTVMPRWYRRVDR